MAERCLEGTKRVVKRIPVSLPVSVCSRCGVEGEHSLLGPDQYGHYCASARPDGWASLWMGHANGETLISKNATVCADCAAILVSLVESCLNRDGP